MRCAALCCADPRPPLQECNPGLTVLVDSNPTRTESCAAIRRDPGAQMQADAQKAPDHNVYDQIIRPSLEKGAGLKIVFAI